MLLFISDLHLSDGSLGPTVPVAAMEFFGRRLNDLALAASFRTGGHYRAIDAIELVLLGDVLDLIRSAAWLSTDARPWHDPHSAPVFDAVGRITADVLDENAAALQILRQLAHEGGVSVPRQRPATVGANADVAADHQTVPVRIHYMVGDHDWPLHLPGEQYGRLRGQVVERMGLANRADRPFPHDPAEGEKLLEVMRRHRVLARHGDIYDPIHFEQDRNTSSVGDALAIELFARFHLEMRRLDGELSAAARAGLAELDDLRPMLLAPVWIDNVLEHTCDSAAMRSHIRLIWDRLVDRLLESPAVESREAWNPVDLVDGLAEALKFRRHGRSGSRRSGDKWLADCFSGSGDPSETYRRHALSEEDFRSRRVNHIVYGHTHHAEFASLESNSARRSAEPFYFNAGAWRHVVSPTYRSPADTLTYLAFYEQDERSGCPFEAWTGSWAREPAGKLIHRFDSRHAA